MQHPPQYLLLNCVHLLIAAIFVTFTVCCTIILTLTVYILRKNFFPEKRLLVRIESKSAPVWCIRRARPQKHNLDLTLNEKLLLVRIESKVGTCLVYQKKGKVQEAQPKFNLKCKAIDQILNFYLKTSSCPNGE